MDRSRNWTYADRDRAFAEYNWTLDAAADAHVVIDSPSDQAPASTKAIVNIGNLVTTEKRAGR